MFEIRVQCMECGYEESYYARLLAYLLIRPMMKCPKCKK